MNYCISLSRATPENTNTERLSLSLSLALLRLSVVPLPPSLSSSVNHTSNSCYYLFFGFRTSFPTSCPKTHSLAIMASAQLREKLGYLKQQTDDRRQTLQREWFAVPTSEKPPLTTWEDGKESGCTCGGWEGHRSLQKRNSRCPGSTRKPQQQERRIRAAIGAWTRAAATPRASWEVVREPERREKSPDGAGSRAAGKPGRSFFFLFYFLLF